jgi:hypothetical protein
VPDVSSAAPIMALAAISAALTMMSVARIGDSGSSSMKSVPNTVLRSLETGKNVAKTLVYVAKTTFDPPMPAVCVALPCVTGSVIQDARALTTVTGSETAVNVALTYVTGLETAEKVAFPEAADSFTTVTGLLSRVSGSNTAVPAPNTAVPGSKTTVNEPEIVVLATKTVNVAT